ncbi:riboflavin synthase alpha chain [Cyanidioschyzon merolae strain 10D]|uniref:Riboflavin synthase n=1 Tax=Cyanidioschyzon merolae (strain NIES-3377 / 10D) TaxID=280699 RepID=M1V8Q9_CYAM1|nr:riboflavin synthase alpha chain [Cyanidioschyzon merolae strain 10D]BAM80834.1 riboflavin synthase alpha chain [Cyanidioschyzon merolae strain 10D]|eukprot:XP_005536870.1 riboflavin synthase alpha chain [Cyanidioschyzon merolae strain 10D]
MHCVQKLGFVPHLFDVHRAGATGRKQSAAACTAIRKRTRKQVQALFTGLVEELGTIVQRTETQREPPAVELSIRAPGIFPSLKLGDSVAVNGACLTVASLLPQPAFQVTLAPETLRRTSLGQLGLGDQVNLERSMAADGRFGGHIVQGHVDTTGEVLDVRLEGDALWYTVRVPRSAASMGSALQPDCFLYVVPKGFIAVDGVSLTVCDVNDRERTFTFMLVPYTQEHVTLPGRRPGDLVNLEMDIIGKYVQRLVESRLSAVR